MQSIYAQIKGENVVEVLRTEKAFSKFQCICSVLHAFAADLPGVDGPSRASSVTRSHKMVCVLTIPRLESVHVAWHAAQNVNFGGASPAGPHDTQVQRGLHSRLFESGWCVLGYYVLKWFDTYTIPYVYMYIYIHYMRYAYIYIYACPPNGGYIYI